MQPSNLTIHPLAARFPEMPAKDFDELKESIRRHGLFEPIVHNDDGQILDGRHRYKALMELGDTSLGGTVNFGDVQQARKPLTEAEFIFESNIHRRHLTQTQIAALCVEFLPVFEKERERGRLANLKQNTDRATVAPSVPKGKASDMAGQQAGVSGRLIRRVKAIKERDPERFEEVRCGKAQVRDVERMFKRDDEDASIKKRNRDAAEEIKRNPPPTRPSQPPPKPLTPEEIEERDRQAVVSQLNEFLGTMCHELDLQREKILRWAFDYLSGELDPRGNQYTGGKSARRSSDLLANGGGISGESFDLNKEVVRVVKACLGQP
jgi:ParB-like nuclease domain